ncbi:MAG TPA: hypothetical protein VHO02_07975 [Fibrobacteria bacterium]|nr:hypothetical protein [Fibrobacteria bacterium]
MAARVDSPSAEALRASDIAPLSVYRPRSLLNIPAGDWGDSLALVEFGDEITAYAAFQEIAVTPEDPSAGTTVRGARVCFRRGRWVGSLPAWAWKGASWYDSMLALPGGAPVGQLPEAFESMLHQDRVPGSERVLASQVLGGAIEAPALAVALDCDGDTAWIYAAMAKRAALGPLKILGWRSASGDEDLFFRENPDLPPASLRFSTRGAVAVEGCFDPDKVNSWLKSQYAGLKSIEKSLNTLKSLSFD